MFCDRLGWWTNPSNHPDKKQKYSPTTTETSVEKKDGKPSSEIRRSIEGIPKSNRWVVRRYLGRCSHSSVYLATSTIEGAKHNLPHEFIIKSAELLEASSIMIEEKYLKSLESPFVVSSYGHEIALEKNEKDPSGRKIYYNTILENCSGKSLKNYMRINKGKLTEDDVKGFASDILLGLKYIHGEEIIHCDIRPNNIILKFDYKRFGNSRRHRLRDKIARFGKTRKKKFDTKRFGLSHRFKAKISGFEKALKKGSFEYNEEWGQRRRGTVGYMSPELIRDKDLDYGADVWAFGCTVFEMLTGEHVWGEYDREGWINFIGKSDLILKIPDSLSGKAKDFLNKCLEKDPVKRWSVDRLLKHRFLACDEEEDEEEEEDFYDNIEYVEVAEDEMFFDVEAFLAGEADFGGEQQQKEVIDIDEEYPKEDSDEDIKEDDHATFHKSFLILFHEVFDN